jgi:putative tryptophan/tyrosine transport system substrate-binding protein
MKRRDFLAGILFVASGRSPWAQPTGKPHRIAIAHAAESPAAMSESGGHPTYSAFFEELGRLGYVEGRNVIVERWSGEGRIEQYGELAQQIARSQPDVIFATSASFVQHLRNATTVIPIVSTTADPVGFGLAVSLARPGGNITGVSVDAGLAVSAKYFELLRELNPALSRIGLVFPRDRRDRPYGRALQSSASRLGISIVGPLLESPILEPAYRHYFDAIMQSGAEALIVTDSPENFPNRDLIVALANKNRLPAIYPYAEYVRLGGLMSYGVDLRERGRRSAGYVAEILKGARAADLPIYQPTAYSFALNLKTANALRLTIPPTLLARVDEVIE